MSTTNLLLCAVLLLNTAAAAAYLIWGMLTARRTKKGKMLIFIRFFLMLFCPVIGILYFVCSMLFHKLLFHKKLICPMLFLIRKKSGRLNAAI